jgi:hypothetical protein
LYSSHPPPPSSPPRRTPSSSSSSNRPLGSSDREREREEASLLCLWILPHTAGKREEERELPGCRERGRMTEEAGLILIYFFMFMNKCLSTFLYLVKHLILTVFIMEIIYYHKIRL